MSTDYNPEWVEWEKIMGRPGLPEDRDERREAFNAGLIALSAQLPQTDPGIETRDEQVSPEVKVRVYTPPTSRAQPLPLIVFCHGGGWQAGNLDTEDHLCRTLCTGASCIVVSVDYRLYPAVEFPTPIDDCYAAYQWAYEHAAELGADKRRFMAWGGSAGASLAISTAHRLIQSGQGDRVTGLVAMAGMFLNPDAVPARYQDVHVSYVENGGDTPVVSGAAMLDAYGMIIGKPRVKDLDWFPVAHAPESLKGFPRTYIINTEREACRDDGRVLEVGLKDAGVPVKRDVMPALPHYFWCFPVAKAGAEFRAMLVEGIKWIIDGL